MKNIFKKIKSWLHEEGEMGQEPAPVPSPADADPAHPPGGRGPQTSLPHSNAATSTPTPTPAASRSIPGAEAPSFKKPRSASQPEPEPLPELTRPPEVVFDQGTPGELVSRGTELYVSCPSCQATWNLRLRFARLLLRASAERKAQIPLSCPTCNQNVGLAADDPRLKNIG
ncbi:MAG: hypothetical protein AB7G93_03315 [Bdellovibrionales bacterium]